MRVVRRTATDIAMQQGLPICIPGQLAQNAVRLTMRMAKRPVLSLLRTCSMPMLRSCEPQRENRVL